MARRPGLGADPSEFAQPVEPGRVMARHDLGFCGLATDRTHHNSPGR